MGATDRLGPGLRQPDVLDLACVHELGERAHRLFDRRVGVDPVLVVEVDVVHVQPAERGVDRLPHVIGRAVDRSPAVVEPPVAELRCEDHLVAPAGDRPADQLLVRALSVDVRRVEKRDPELEGPVNGRDRFRFVGRPVPGRHPHATEALLRDLETFAAEGSALHLILPRRSSTPSRA